MLRQLGSIALTWYYRSVSVAGRSRIPATGPVFLAVNHPNAMVDALVVGCSMPRRVTLTAKSTVFANPLLASFLHRVGVVPLKRASESAQHTPADVRTVANENGSANTTASTADPNRNAESFRAVCEALAAGKAVVVFPEGRSHDEPQLIPLRTGLARMALLARDSFNVSSIQIIPVGLLFERKEEPRTRVLLQIGQPIHVDAIHAGDKAVGTLTALVAQRLAEVTLNFASADDARRIGAVGETLAALLEPVTSVRTSGPSLSAVLAMTRRAERVRQRVEQQDAGGNGELREQAQHFEQQLGTFRARLEQHQIAVSDLLIDVGANPGARFVLREGLLAALIAPVAWWGRITHFVPLRIARWLALRRAKNRDEPAMNTIVFGLILVLLAYVVETAAVAALFGGWWALLFLVTLVPSASSDLRYGDRVKRRSQRMRTYVLFRRKPQLRNELLSEAAALQQLAAAIEVLAR